ncbi:hypothetical protein [Microcoleus sp. FACHB-672]|nr:hypothetical protein [Microcoleus sp. FACHB-672]MBD2040765.1 hypothetical protein [Microcoleus sp. FACHB-672]
MPVNKGTDRTSGRLSNCSVITELARSAFAWRWGVLPPATLRLSGLPV